MRRREVAEEKDQRAVEHDGGKAQSDFTLLKDDYVAGVDEGASTPSVTSTPDRPKIERDSPFAEVDPTPSEVPAGRLKWSTRRDFLLYGAGAVATAGALWWLLPSDPTNPADP